MHRIIAGYESAAERGHITEEQAQQAIALTIANLSGELSDADFDAKMVEIGVAEAEIEADYAI